MKTKITKLFLIFLLLNSLLLKIGISQLINTTLNNYEGYYLRSNNYPNFLNKWNPYTLDLNNGECQGVTHDNTNWFFTWTHNNKGFLIKVPYELPLNNSVFEQPGVIIKQSDDDEYHEKFPELINLWHWGDPDHYEYPPNSGIEYIIVPCRGGSPYIAIFRASNMKLAAYGKLNQYTSSWCNHNSEHQRSVGWCAVNPKTGILYTSEDFDYKTCIPGYCSLSLQACFVNEECPEGGECNKISDCDNQSFIFDYNRELLRYKIHWEDLPTDETTCLDEIILEPILPKLEFRGESGEFIELYNMQGGEFSLSGELLYISTGSGCCESYGVGQQYAIDGLHVFDTLSWRRIKRSYNHASQFPITNIPRYFDYYYDLGCTNLGATSPQGLTIWDLDNEITPHINGQLHVLVFIYNKTGHNWFTFEHFGGRIYVDPINGFDEPMPSELTDDDTLPGGYLKPFKTFDHAVNCYPDWQGVEIILKSDIYPETGVYNRRVKINSKDGSSYIGLTVNKNDTLK